MMERNRRILVVDDNRAIHDDFCKILRGRPKASLSELESDLFGTAPTPATAPMPEFDVSSAYQGAEGIEMVRAARAAGAPFALAVVDMRMPPGLDGIQTITQMWAIDPDLQVVICTAYSDATWSDIFERFGATDRLLILKKPFDLVEVCQLAFALTEKWLLAEQGRVQMAELTRSRANLAASLALARAVQEATVDGILAVGNDRKVATANSRFVEMWRIPPDVLATHDDDLLIGFVLDQLVHPDEFIARVHYLYDHATESASDEIALKDGRVFERWTGPMRSETNEIHGRLWCFRDISERRKLELDRAVVTERMAAMGRLAAGVGHEINNPLTYALANVDELIEVFQSNEVMSREDVTARLDEARDGLWRIRVIVRDLQTLARSNEVHGEVDLAEAIEQALQIAGPELRHRAPIVRRYEPVPPVLGSRTRLGQVFLNLIINAAQAIPVGKAAENRIEIAIRSTDSHVLVEIIDTGAGIAPEHVDRIFDPFFTTKDIGAGTGLGLSISREIVASHKGTLTAKSTLGAGTTMTVTLPHSPGVRAKTMPLEVIAPARRAKVLVIDDEPLIGRTLERSLGNRHQVVVTVQAREALSRIERGERFDLILCDVMMPDVSGMDVHAYLAREHPSLLPRVVFMTGGASTSTAKSFLTSIANAHIDKPFSKAEIVRIVDQHLEAAL